ncbi:MAG TPA: polyribonucleotide nucleotidyltransferase, partial [Trebonia sp.]|nr:polyribonucleotide nucleotidyltransferase [Trebonia sp.]
IENVDEVIHIGDKIQVEIREIDDRGKLSLVPVEVIEREAAGEDLGGGGDEDRPGIRSERSERGDRPHRERSGGEGGGDRRPRQRSRGGQRD